MVALTLLCGPYKVRISVFHPDGQLVSYTERDFTRLDESECLREMTVSLDEPVHILGPRGGAGGGAVGEEMTRVEVYLSGSNTMYWYDNVIVAKFTNSKPFKVRHSAPELISKIHYLP